jgi:hypothetical protein
VSLGVLKYLCVLFLYRRVLTLRDSVGTTKDTKVRGSEVKNNFYLFLPVNKLHWKDKDSLKAELNPLNAELNPICHLLSLLGGATIVVVSRLRVNSASINLLLEC